MTTARECPFPTRAAQRETDSEQISCQACGSASEYVSRHLLRSRGMWLSVGEARVVSVNKRQDVLEGEHGTV